MFDLDRCLKEDGGKCIVVNLNGASDTAEHSKKEGRLICSDRKGNLNLIVLSETFDENLEEVYAFDGYGASSTSSIFLENIPQTVTLYLICWDCEGYLLHMSFNDYDEYKKVRSGLLRDEAVTKITSKSVTMNKGEYDND